MKITLLTGKMFDVASKVDYPLEVVRSKSFKRLSLRIDTKKNLPILNVPFFCSVAQAVDFANKYKIWVAKKMLLLPEKKLFTNGETISLFGQEFAISHRKDMRGGAFVDGNELVVCGGEEFLHRRVRDFIKSRAASVFLEMSQQKAKQIGCKVNRVLIKDTKSRWGSCSSLDNINYSWRIALAPIAVVDYLMAHEVAHLKHKNHSEEFWDCVKNLAVDFDNGHTWLKKNAKLLNLYE